MDHVNGLQTPAPSGMSFEAVRRNNLSAVLRHVHYAGSISRAALSPLTGLNRSTISALVSELVNRDLIVSSIPEKTARRGRGRPGAVLQPNSAVAVGVVSVDVRSIVFAIVGLGGRVLRERKVILKAPPTIQQVKSYVLSSVSVFSLDREDVRIVEYVLCLDGLISTDDQSIRYAAKLGWEDVDVREELSECFGRRPHVVNRAGAAALAESRFGIARGRRSVVYIEGVDDGIVSAILQDGQPIRGARGYASQIGDSVIGPPHGVRGRITARTVNDEVNRRSLLKAMGVPSATDDAIRMSIYEGPTPEIRDVAERQAEVLSMVIANTISMLNPEVMVLNGFVASVYEADPGHMQTLVRRQCSFPLLEGFTIVSSALGEHACLIGAAEEGLASLLAGEVDMMGSGRSSD
ncbi:ROK family protein [Actinomyces sp. B33]|uniref:ROK family transcriptional regulator n=1 Tax=Actinomyces sp. B33 TaxID=2942131 RepID=UPI00234097D3|nr:ROK family transcriptional regulator [Actinomyces sp. B33]MDC4232520.1 ROK family protein [Actinomyces sp. B33]